MAGAHEHQGVAPGEGPDRAGLPVAAWRPPLERAADAARKWAVEADSRSATVATVASWAARITPVADIPRI